MRNPGVAKKYAEALYDVGEKAGETETILKDMKLIEDLIQSSAELGDYLETPMRAPLSSKELFKTVFLPYVSTVTGRTLLILAENKRTEALRLLPKAFCELYLRKQNITHVVVESVSLLDEDTLSAIREHMKKKCGGEIRLEQRTTPPLLGGIRLIWNNTILDYSIKGKLRALRAHIK